MKTVSHDSVRILTLKTCLYFDDSVIGFIYTRFSRKQSSVFRKTTTGYH